MSHYDIPLTFFSYACFKSLFVRPIPPTLDQIRELDKLKTEHDLHEAHYQAEHWLHEINKLEMRLGRLTKADEIRDLV
jgi:hypothetical protein